MVKSAQSAKILLIDVEPGTAQQVRANLPPEYIFMEEKSGTAADAVKAERPDLIIAGSRSAEEKFSAGAGNGETGSKALPVIILTGDNKMSRHAAADRGICHCPGEPLDGVQLRELVAGALAVNAGSRTDSAFPVDVELLIRYTVEELVEENISLGRALKQFTTRFSDMFLPQDRK